MHDPGFDAFVWRPEEGSAPPRHRGILSVLRAAGCARPLPELARALAASPPARELPGVVAAVRERPSPLLVFAGPMDEEGRARLKALARILDTVGPRLCILSWTDVEDACGRLAEALLERLGRETVEASALLGVPRGGTIVAGLLGYALGLPAGRVRSISDETPVPPEGVAIVVDDCVLTGVRLREVLKQAGAPRIAVAALAADPRFCESVESEEPRLVACVAGRHLHDFGPELLGAAEDAWRGWWRERGPEGADHTALLDHVSFPWSEPTTRLWNPVTEAVEEGWWLTPPSLCIRHRFAPEAFEVQLADDRPGIERLAPAVVPVERGGATLLVDCERKRSVTLSGTARELWIAWSAGGPSAAADAVAARYDESVSRVREDLDRLLQDLAARGVLAAEPVEPEG